MHFINHKLFGILSKFQLINEFIGLFAWLEYFIVTVSNIMNWSMQITESEFVLLFLFCELTFYFLQLGLASNNFWCFEAIMRYFLFLKILELEMNIHIGLLKLLNLFKILFNFRIHFRIIYQKLFVFFFKVVYLLFILCLHFFHFCFKLFFCIFLHCHRHTFFGAK